MTALDRRAFMATTAACVATLASQRRFPRHPGRRQAWASKDDWPPTLLARADEVIE
jgi:hypothetical protein